ncbi:hypothetical protein K8I85_02810, partial [bacterium]|nr:hypothetical protein [bacterium]
MLLHLGLSGVLVAAPIATAQAQVLAVTDDEYGIPFGEPLLVEPFGVMDNDLLDGEPAGENGVTVTLVTDAAQGALTLAADGSFTYAPGQSFDGLDEFVYEAAIGETAAQGTVTLSACSGGPTLFDCWNENAYRAKLAGFGFATFDEGFENPLAWGGVRTPDTAISVSHKGIEWRSNHPDPPASNPVTTSNGAAHSGQWGAYDANHGYATGSPGICDVDNPPVHCLYHDGLTGTREPGGAALHGVGAYVRGTYGANVGILLDGGAPFGGGKMGLGSYFFGAIDASPAGFSQFRFRELDGKVGQALYVWLDDFV